VGISINVKVGEAGQGDSTCKSARRPNPDGVLVLLLRPEPMELYQTITIDEDEAVRRLELHDHIDTRY
jgi:hypothetical protein